MNVFGLTRFSVLAAHGLKRTMNIPYEERIKFIFQEDRLCQRIQLFDAYVVPELRIMTQKYKYFCQFVFISPELPFSWKLKLRRTLQGVRHKIVIVNPKEEFIAKARDTVLEATGEQRFFTFRVDDDDALPSGYLDKIVQNADKKDEFLGISFNNGYYIKRKSLNSYIVSVKSVPCIAIGLGAYSPGGRNGKTIFCFGNHARLHERIPVIQLDYPYWIRTIHESNDSMARLREGDEYSTQNLIQLMKNDFPAIDPKKALACL